MNCVESLKDNPLAKETELYIALDFPFKKEHEYGYENICAYLSSIAGFKNVIIIKRDINLGAALNFISAQADILKNHDRIIVSEDDNVFSPNFLEYINKGLEKFKDDKSVLAINGYRDFYNIKYDTNNYFRQSVSFAAWGYGIWRDRIEEYEKKMSKQYFMSILLNPYKLYRIWKDGTYKLYNLLRSVYGFENVTDGELGIYMTNEKKTVIMPTYSKVRNTGWDGSGVNCSPENKNIADTYMNQAIDANDIFTYMGEDWKYFNENQQIYRKQFVWKKNIPCILVNFIYRKIVEKFMEGKKLVYKENG